ncbi:hypothetical protein A6J33_023105 [Pantoea sp. FDAARGOS_194]|nr:hypothetical protein A6J33_023105 [Pantoea sp. FDAARGOS_194]
MNVTVISEMDVRSESQTHENELLHKNLELLQARYDAALTSRDDEVEKKVTAMSAVLNESQNTLTNRYVELLKENQNLKNTIHDLSSNDSQRQVELKESKIRELSDKLTANNHKIDEVQASLHETSANAGSHKKQCEEKKDYDVFASHCSLASRYEAEASSLREKINSLEKYSEIINAQILTLEGRSR